MTLSASEQMPSTLNQKETLLKCIDSKHQMKHTEQTLSSGKKYETPYYCVCVLLHINNKHAKKVKDWK